MKQAVDLGGRVGVGDVEVVGRPDGHDVVGSQRGKAGDGVAGCRGVVGAANQENTV